MADAGPPAAPPPKGIKAMLIEFLVVALIGAGAGAGFDMTRPAPGDAQKAKGTAAAVEPSTVYDLPPIVTNLGAPQDTWVRLEASMVFDPKTLPHPEAVAGKISEDILAYIRTVTLKQLEGPIGLQAIREDLNDRAAIRSDGKVRELVLRTLVVQ
jgi:flagellar FliL protein